MFIIATNDLISVFIFKTEALGGGEMAWMIQMDGCGWRGFASVGCSRMLV